MAIGTRARGARLLVVVLVSASLAVITLDYRQGPSGPLAGLGRAAQAAMAPLQRAATGIIRPIDNFFSGIARLPSLERENRRLKDQQRILETEIAAGAQYRQLYEQTLAILGLRQLTPGSIGANVIANGVSNFHWTITIGKGSASGIAVDQPVIAGTADAPVLVGRVVQVTSGSAEVQLIVDPDHFAAAVLNVSGEAGLIQGQGDRDLRMTLISTATKIEGGEPVFTEAYEVNGQRGRYPPGILIGTVSRLVPGDNELQAHVSVKPAVDFTDLRFVLVLKVPEDGAS